MSEDIEVLVEGVEEREVGVSQQIPTPVGGGDGTGIPETDIRAWDAEILRSAERYADEKVAAIQLPEMPEIPEVPVKSVNSKVGDVVLSAEDVGAATPSDVDEKIAAIELPTVDVNKAYVDEADLALGRRIDDKADASVLAGKADKSEVNQALSGKADATATAEALATKASAQAVQTALADKSDKGHGHAFSEITGTAQPSQLGGGTLNGSSFLAGDGQFKIPPGATTAQIEAAVNTYLTNNPPSASTFERRGSGFPEGVVAAPPGTYYTDTVAGGTQGAIRWVKKSGTGTTGWSVVVGDTGFRDITSIQDPQFMTISGSKVIAQRTPDGVMVTGRCAGISGDTTMHSPRIYLPTGYWPEASLNQMPGEAVLGLARPLAGTAPILMGWNWYISSGALRGFSASQPFARNSGFVFTLNFKCTQPWPSS